MLNFTTYIAIDSLLFNLKINYENQKIYFNSYSSYFDGFE